jgi:hypothetical protein
LIASIFASPPRASTLLRDDLVHGQERAEVAGK